MFRPTDKRCVFACFRVPSHKVGDSRKTNCGSKALLLCESSCPTLVEQSSWLTPGHQYLQGASSPFHPQQRPPLSPLPCYQCNPCLQHTVSRDVCARSFTLQSVSFSSCAPCVPCQKQRMSPGLHARDLAAGVRPCRATSSESPLGTSAP